MQCLQKLTALRGTIDSHFNQKHHLINCRNFKVSRYAAPAE